MASFNIHLAIGKKYMEKNPIIKNEKEFYKGVIDPDLTTNKKVTHYSGNVDGDDLIRRLTEKVLLNLYLKEHDIETDYDRGVFLHLVTDYLFYNFFFDREYLLSVTHPEFVQDLYHSYDIVNEHVKEKYDIDYSEFGLEVKPLQGLDENDKGIIDIDKLDNFIEYVSSIDLDDYRNKIIENDSNILPIIG